MQLNVFLKQIYDITKYHENIANITGENFNIFRILGLSTDELSHTSFIASLLNPKGSHGRGEAFLVLFLEEVNIQDFKVLNAKLEKEKNIGPIDREYQNGGQIDILITDNSNNQIIIENKIYAKDQKNQLLRYSNYNKKAKIFYLTLDGTDASPYSLGSLGSESYIRISYSETILKWLEKCRKESASFPLLRETISQYIFLLKKITQQARSQEMGNDIIGTIMSDIKNIESAFSIAKNMKKLKKQIIITKLLPSLKEMAERNELEFSLINDNYFEANWGFDFKKEEWKNYKLRFKFLAAGFKNFIYGFNSDNDVLKIHDTLKVISDTEWKVGIQTRAYKSLGNYRDWDDKVFIILSSDRSEKENDLIEIIEIKIKELLALTERFKDEKGLTL